MGIAERNKFYNKILADGNMKERILLAIISPIYRAMDSEAATQAGDKIQKPLLNPAEYACAARERYKREGKQRDGNPGKYIEPEPPEGTVLLGDAAKEILAER